MRLHFSIFLLLLGTAATTAQDMKPRIVGQKEISMDQGTAVTIQLTDLYVEEDEVQSPATGNEPPSEGGDNNETDPDNSGNNGTGDGPGQQGDNGSEPGNDNGGKDKDHGKDHDNSPKGQKPDHEKKDKDHHGHHGNGRTYPDGYTLEVLAGDNYSVSGTTVTPDPTFAGLLLVDVRVDNEEYESPIFTLNITVNVVLPENVPPEITGQLPLSTSVNKPVTIEFSDLIVQDPDDSYPQGFTLKIFAGDQFSASGNIVTPAKDFAGAISVKVTVNDGENDSPPFYLKIDVVSKENAAPTIVGQVPLSISVNQPVTISLSQLVVQDDDNRYPDDFALNVLGGDHYTANHVTVIPESDFTGDLFVNVKVSDGKAFSNIFALKISVMAPPDVKPVITGQAGLKLPEGHSLEIQLSNLVVEDPDNRYPDDFGLAVEQGDSYSVSGNRITPREGFLGMLTVIVTVNDGTVSSDPYRLQVEVIRRGQLEIIGQISIAIPEDSLYHPLLKDLIVNDPDEKYPSGFNLEITGGEDYDVKGGTIKPASDFYGNLRVPVSVTRGASRSAEFSLLLTVVPVDDPPEVTVEPDPLAVTGSDPVTITSSLELADVDDDDLLYAEVAIDRAWYEPEAETLAFQPSDNIHGVFEADSGVLYLFGQASLMAYQTVLRSVTYARKSSSDSVASHPSKAISFKVSDGKAISAPAARQLVFETGLGLDVPSAFTPNNDRANDTWKITSHRDYGDGSPAIRVYDKKGNMVFQTIGFEREWDGQLNGMPLPADVYFYIIDVNLPDKKLNRKGIVSILR